MRDEDGTPTPATNLPLPGDAGAVSSPPGEARAAASLWRFLVPVLLVLLVVVAFMPALDAGLVDWDDDDLLIHNTRYHTLSPESLRWMFTTSFAGHFQPLTWLTYTLDWALWQRESFGYHLTSVLLHALTAVAFYFVTRRLLALAWGSGAARSTRVVLGAALAALLFAVHPLRAESVAWLAERRDVLSGLFYVLSVGCYLRYAMPKRIDAGLDTGARDACPDADRSTGGRPWCYAGSLILCAVSLLAKASAVTLPFVLLVLDLYPLRRWRRPASLLVSPPPVARIWVEKLPFFMLAAAGGLRAIVAQAEGATLYPLARHDLVARLAQACYGLMFYLWKTLLPTGLGPLYEIPPREVLLGPGLWLSAAVVAGIGWTVVRFRRRLPAVAAAMGVYAIVLLPVLGFLQSGPQLVADRYSYLSCMGFAVLAGAGLGRLLTNDGLRLRRNLRALVALAAVVLLASLVRATFRQAEFWASPLTLWARGVQISPNSAIAHTNYADILARVESYPEAADHYRQALRLNPRDAVALHHFGDLHRLFGHTEKAIGYYLRALRVDPDRRGACFSLAQLMVDTGRARDALRVLRDGARRHPDALVLIDYLAQLLATHPDAEVRNANEALRWALQVNRAQSFSRIPSLMTLASAYAEAGRFDDAVETTRRALARSDHTTSEPLIAELRHRLTLFRAGKPYHFGD